MLEQRKKSIEKCQLRLKFTLSVHTIGTALDFKRSQRAVNITIDAKKAADLIGLYSRNAP